MNCAIGWTCNAADNDDQTQVETRDVEISIYHPSLIRADTAHAIFTDAAATASYNAAVAYLHLYLYHATWLGIPRFAMRRDATAHEVGFAHRLSVKSEG